MLKKIILILFFSLFFTNLIFAQNYYADIKINIKNTGLVTIDGVTNFEDFKNISTQKFTSKTGENWILNITKEEIFEEFIFELEMPEDSIITYVKTTPNLRFETRNEKLFLIGTGKSRNFELIIQYQIKDTQIIKEKYNIKANFIIIFLTLFVLTLYYIIFEIRHKRKNTSNNSQKEKNLSNLSSRQQKIMQILKEQENITQKELEHILNIPKSSVSRNVNSLYSRNLINKTINGKSVILSLKK